MSIIGSLLVAGTGGYIAGRVGLQAEMNALRAQLAAQEQRIRQIEARLQVAKELLSVARERVQLPRHQIGLPAHLRVENLFITVRGMQRSTVWPFRVPEAPLPRLPEGQAWYLMALEVLNLGVNPTSFPSVTRIRFIGQLADAALLPFEHAEGRLPLGEVVQLMAWAAGPANASGLRLQLVQLPDSSPLHIVDIDFRTLSSFTGP